MPPRGGEPPDDAVVPIVDLLRDLGFDTEEARRQARAVLEAAGLTNPRKRNIAVRKRAQAGEVIRRACFRHCGATGCREQAAGSGRRPVRAAPHACEVCGGRGTDQSLRSMATALAAAGRTRLLIVGGSPNTHRQLKDALEGTAVELRLVDGQRAPKPRQAQQWAAWADLIVIWATTEVGHKVSGHFQRPEYAAHTIIVPRRGVEAVAQEVARHLTQHRARSAR